MLGRVELVMLLYMKRKDYEQVEHHGFLGTETILYDTVRMDT